MTKYFYLNENTFFHRMDPRAKLILTLAHFVAIVLLIEQTWLLVLFLTEAFVLAGISKSFANVRRLRVILIMVGVMGVVSWVVIGGGDTKLIGFITYESVMMGVSSSLKNLSCILTATVLLSTTRNEELAAAISKFGVPYRGTFAFSSALRMAPTLISVCLTTISAQKSRGLDVENCGFFTKLRRMVPMIAPAFLMTIKSTDRFSMAIESKGFGYTKERGSYLTLKYTTADISWIVFSLAVMAASLVVSVTGAFSCFQSLN